MLQNQYAELTFVCFHRICMCFFQARLWWKWTLQCLKYSGMKVCWRQTTPYRKIWLDYKFFVLFIMLC